MPETSVTVGVDTNILINFGDFKRLDWKALFPSASGVRVLIAAKVQAEMDVHKDNGAGYVRKRARAFQKVLRSAEDSNYEVDFEHQGVSVSCVFLKRPSMNLLDHESFDINDDDELIVAQYHYAQQAYGDIAMLANDASPIRAARHAGMRALRPDAWEADRSEEEDEATRGLRDEVRRLQRVLGARPKLEARGLVSEVPITAEVVFGPTFDIRSFQYHARINLEAGVPLPHRGDLTSKFGRQSSFVQMYNIPNVYGLGDSELDAWDEERETFYSHFDRVDEVDLLNRINRLIKVRLFEFEICNNGEAVEEDIFVDIEARANASLVDPDDIEPLNDWGLNAPTPPGSPRFDLKSLKAIGSAISDPSEIESIDITPKRERLRCKLLMQGQSQKVRIRALATDEEAESAILVRIRARHLLDPIVKEIRLVPHILEVTEPEIRQLLIERAELMPSDQEQIILDAFGELRS